MLMCRSAYLEICAGSCCRQHIRSQCNRISTNSILMCRSAFLEFCAGSCYSSSEGVHEGPDQLKQFTDVQISILRICAGSCCRQLIISCMLMCQSAYLEFCAGSCYSSSEGVHEVQDQLKQYASIPINYKCLRQQYINAYLKKWGNPASFSFTSFFQNDITFLQQINVKKYSSSIQTHNLLITSLLS